jgi:hypothetical protein
MNWKEGAWRYEIIMYCDKNEWKKEICHLHIMKLSFSCLYARSSFLSPHIHILFLSYEQYIFECVVEWDKNDDKWRSRIKCLSKDMNLLCRWVNEIELFLRIESDIYSILWWVKTTFQTCSWGFKSFKVSVIKCAF